MLKIIQFLKINYIYLFVIISFSLFISCTNTANDSNINKEGLLASVGDSLLYLHDIETIRDEYSSDSENAINQDRIVNDWIREQLLIQTAKDNLSKDEIDVEKMVNDYRKSLIINSYKQKYLAKHLDTLVTTEDITQYVNEYSDMFVLQEPLYRFYLAKILNKNKKDINFIKSLFSKRNINLMQDFNLENTTIITNYDNHWYSPKDIVRILPSEAIIKDVEKLRAGKITIFKDDDVTYIIRTLDIVPEGKMSPTKYIRKKVRDIILHNRKIALAKQLEYEIYEVAKNENKFKVY